MWDDSFKKSEMYINTDTYYMKHTYTAAVAAVKTVLLAAKAIIKQSYKYAYAVVRPPGHHSGLKTQPHGFSFFNNVAIASEYVLKSGAYKKIAIVDWDAHHGEGTQNIFYKRNDVLYISLHRFDNGKFFPHVPQSSS
jgi:histone deacetylase 6